MSKKKILAFIDWYHPAFKAGGPVRSLLNYIESMSGEFDFYVVAGDKEYMEQSPMKGIISDSWQAGKFGEQVLFLSSPNPELIGKILKEVNPDAVWLNSMFSKNFSIIPMRLWKGKTILSPRGMLAPEALKLKKTKKAIYLKLAGLLGWHKHVIFHATNAEEEKQIRTFFPSNEIRRAPNFPTFGSSYPVPRTGKQPNILLLVQLARIAPEKNNLFAIELLHGLKISGSIQLDVYGSEYDKEYAVRCRELAASLPDNIRVSFKGNVVPEKVGETLSQYDFLFFPSRGENYGHAIVQSWAAGTPVLISDATPWKELKKRNVGWEISNSSLAVWREVLIHCLQMGAEEHQLMRIESQKLATALQEDPETLVLNQNLFR